MTKTLDVKDGGEIGSNPPADKAEDTFNSDLVLFKKHNVMSMDLALKLSKSAFVHACNHGNMDRLQAFYDAMTQNWNRKSAFLKWAGDHGPIKFENKVFKKDKGPKARPWDLEGAMSIPFWDHDPEPEIVTWTRNDLLNKLLKTVKSYSEGERYVANSDEDVAFAKMLTNNLIKFGNGNTATN